jgi:hypothetical protein
MELLPAIPSLPTPDSNGIESMVFKKKENKAGQNIGIYFTRSLVLVIFKKYIREPSLLNLPYKVLSVPSLFPVPRY